MTDGPTSDLPPGTDLRIEMVGPAGGGGIASHLVDQAMKRLIESSMLVVASAARTEMMMTLTRVDRPMVLALCTGEDAVRNLLEMRRTANERRLRRYRHRQR